MASFESRYVVQHQSYYRIESNSQQRVPFIPVDNSCTTSKLLQNWKQFTTGDEFRIGVDRLYNIKVITELKAIHNDKCKRANRKSVVQHQSYYRIESNSQQLDRRGRRNKGCTTSKLLQNWKQFTTQGGSGVVFYGCTTSKLLQNWKQFTTDCRVLSYFQQLYNIKVITELKAIHNWIEKGTASRFVVQHQSYYRIESNSQLLGAIFFNQSCCTTSKLLQNWKQFTTLGCRDFLNIRLYNIKVITELKAIHNSVFRK